MAHVSSLTGSISESLAAAMLMENGFSVFTSLVPEAYDLIAVGTLEDGKKETFRIQVKTIKIRNDREGQIVVRGANQKGVPYSTDDVDYLFGIYGTRGYLIPNNNQVEYWSSNFEAAANKWTEFKLDERGLADV